MVLPCLVPTTNLGNSLLAFTADSAAQSSAQTHIHSAIVVIDTSNNAGTVKFIG